MVVVVVRVLEGVVVVVIILMLGLVFSNVVILVWIIGWLFVMRMCIVMMIFFGCGD